MKILIVLLLFGIVFWLGYYAGQRPDEVKQQLRDLSGRMIEKTIGLNQGLALRQEFLRTKEKILAGKSYLLDNNYQGAAQSLKEALEPLGRAIEMDTEKGVSERVSELMQEVRETHRRLVEGDATPPETLDPLQEKVDDLLP